MGGRQSRSVQRETTPALPPSQPPDVSAARRPPPPPLPQGANIAADIARGELSEATIGYTVLENALLLRDLFQGDSFYVTLAQDVAGVEMAGTLKNIVALAAGFVEGLGLGPNTKAAVMRAGLAEMVRFAQALYPAVRAETFFESCGVADLIATCYGGRNRRVAREYALRVMRGEAAAFGGLEAELLGGQKLQGALTSEEVQLILRRRGWEGDYPLFTTGESGAGGLHALRPAWRGRVHDGADARRRGPF